MTLTALCFDLDDTLYNYEQYARAGLNNAASILEKRAGKQLSDELLELYFNEEQTEGTFDIIVERHGLSEELIEPLVDAFHSATAPMAPYPETKPLLARLETEYKLGLITDGRGGQQKIDRLGIRGYFDEILVTPQINSSKHEPIVFHQVLNSLGTDPSSAVYIGDDPRVDFPVPNNLGMYTVRLKRGRYRSLEPDSQSDRPDYTIDSLNALCHLLSTFE